jgi:hypothetical protein
MHNMGILLQEYKATKQQQTCRPPHMMLRPPLANQCNFVNDGSLWQRISLTDLYAIIHEHVNLYWSVTAILF